MRLLFTSISNAWANAKVNDHVFAEVIDEYPSALKSGIIAFQQHAGAQMEIQFKDPKIKLLPAKQ